MPFISFAEGVYIHRRTDGTLFNLSRLMTKIKVRRILIGEMFFAHVNALASHSDENLYKLMNIFVLA